MKTILLLICVLLITSNISFGQDKNLSLDNRAQSVFVEVGGNGLLLSANYDTRFLRRQNGLGARVGIGYLADPFGDADGLTFPLGLNYLFGKNRNYFELGAGATIYNLNGNSFFDVNASGTVFVPSMAIVFNPPIKVLQPELLSLR